jgi:hypothetical protein
MKDARAILDSIESEIIPAQQLEVNPVGAFVGLSFSFIPLDLPVNRSG